MLSTLYIMLVGFSLQILFVHVVGLTSLKSRWLWPGLDKKDTGKYSNFNLKYFDFFLTIYINKKFFELIFIF